MPTPLGIRTSTGPVAPVVRDDAPAVPDASTRGLDPMDPVPIDLEGPAPATPGVAPKLRKLFFARLGALLRHTHWQSLDGAPLGAAPVIDRGTLDRVAARLAELASDPAKGGKIEAGTIEEAAVCCMAELGRAVPEEMTREATGLAEFVTSDGVLWDVKSPRSPPPGAHWHLDADHILVKVRHDLAQDNSVFLNLSACTPAHTRAVVDAVRAGLSPTEQARVVVLVNR